MEIEDIVVRLYRLLWAKSNPMQPLWTHMVQTGIVAQVLIEDGCFYPLKSELVGKLNITAQEIANLIGYIAAVHDIGKAHPSFVGSGAVPEAQAFLDQQGMTIDTENHGPFRHEAYGAHVLSQLWWENNRFPNQRIRRLFASIVRYHHQGKCGWNGTLDPSPQTDLWHAVHIRLEGQLWDYFTPTSDLSITHMDYFFTLLLGIVITADWIASGDAFKEISADGSFESITDRTRQVAQSFLQRNHMTHTRPWQQVASFTKLWPEIPQNRMRPVQKAVEAFFEAHEGKRPLAVLIEAPMGEGKTEAALYAATQLAKAWGKEGFYLALPTAASAGQMCRRVDAMLKRTEGTSAKLMHSLAWVADDETLIHGGDVADVEALWTHPMRRGLISPVAVGTVDQVMLSVLRTKYGVLRLAGLTQKVLIIDELHSYDAYMSQILTTLLQWCRGLHIPVIMLSATLPRGKKEEFMACFGNADVSASSYPCLTVAYEDGDVTEIPVSGSHQLRAVQVEWQPLMNRPTDIARLVIHKVDKTGGCYGIIVNTVQEAQDIYRQIQSQQDGSIRCLLFHARFAVYRREEIEKEILQALGPGGHRPERLIVVATQVVEQSLDIDFDYLLTDLCPIDLLLQRIGRVWRRDDPVRPDGLPGPQVTVFMPTAGSNYGPSGLIYAPIILKRSEIALKGLQTVRIPEDIPKLVEAVYTGSKTAQKDWDQWADYRYGEALKGSAATGQSIGTPRPRSWWLADEDDFYDDTDDTFLSAKTRLGEPSVRLALLPDDMFQEMNATSAVTKQLARQVLRYSLSVRRTGVRFIRYYTCMGGQSCQQGRGLLHGVWLLPAKDGVCCFDDGTEIVMDEELGLLIRGERDDI